MSESKTVEQLINANYYETEVPELLITENGHIPKICKVIFEYIKPSLKKNFKEQEMISMLEEDRELIETLTDISNYLLWNMIRNIGQYKIKEMEKGNGKISSFWYLNK